MTRQNRLEHLARVLAFQRIGNRAVRKAQAENRKLGIPNWYLVNGVLVSDQPSVKTAR